MKIYLCGRFAERALLRHVRDYTFALCPDVEITSRWLQYNDTGRLLTDAERCRRAVENIHDIQRAQVMVVFSSDQESRGARYVEFGLALAYGMQVCVIGTHDRHLFMAMPQVTVHQTISEVIDYLALRRLTRPADEGAPEPVTTRTQL